MSGIKGKLTQKYVDSVAPEGKRFIVWDTEIAAFGLRVLPTGAKAYIIPTASVRAASHASG
jgi:hypothetical protein